VKIQLFRTQGLVNITHPHCGISTCSTGCHGALRIAQNHVQVCTLVDYILYRVSLMIFIQLQSKKVHGLNESGLNMKKPLQQTRMGRPSLPTEKVRCKRVETFVTRSEMEKLAALMPDSKDSLSSVCYRIICKYLEVNSTKSST
jgi:hypothetical protein